MTRGWIAGLVCTGLAVSAAIYTYHLDRVPAYLTLDEAHFSVHAESIARTGRNLNGQILPPLVSLEDSEGEPFNLPWGTTYYLPFGIYLIAGALKLLPLTEATVRMPSAVLGGVINVALIFAVAWALFRSRLAAAGSAIVLALAPANVIISRQALDSVCQPPFILGALWCLATYLRKPDPRLALAAGAILGGGLYAYVTSVMFMPFYLALFWFVSWRAGVLERRTIWYSIAGFGVALLPMALWLIAHPDAARSLQMQYNRADPGSATLMQTLASRGAMAALADAVGVYWSYFDPSFLFVQGGNARNLSTGDAGVFLYATAVLAPVGLYAVRHRPLIQLLLIIGLVASPVPAVIKGAPYAIQRASGLLIYLSLLSGVGLAALAFSRWRRAQLAAGIIAISMAWQFGTFYREYHGEYRARSAKAYDATAFRDAAELIIRGDTERAADAVYLPTNFYDVGAKWRFYTLAHERPDLWRRTKYFAGAPGLRSAPVGSIAVLPQAVTSQPPDGWATIGIVKNLSGDVTAAVLRRQP